LEKIVIDGAQKSGSGTIVRLGLVLSSLTGLELRIDNIRARRDNPGLRPQHLQAVKAVQEMTRGRLSDVAVGSSRLEFHPGRLPMAGAYAWDIGTAGSTTMLASTVLPLAAFADGPCTFLIEGGLFQDFAPSAFHTQYALLSILARMGFNAELTIQRPGYVPRGGGRIMVRTSPVAGCLKPLALGHRFSAERVWGIALSSHLREREVSERMAGGCRHELKRHRVMAEFRIVFDNTASQPGAALAVFAEDSAGAILGADRAGARGRPSEEIARHVARSLLEDLRTGATVDRFLADQLILYAALAKGTSVYRIPRVTDHVEANLWLVQQIMAVQSSSEDGLLSIRGIGYRRSQA
jgi:RNA 3'-terminal phosphate cyclase (ATP)